MNTPTVPRRHTEPATETASTPQGSSRSAGDSIPNQRSADRKRPNPLSIRRYAQVVRQTAWRLTKTVREATADGSLGSVEISHLHVWVTADLVPWAIESVEQVDDVAKGQALALVAEVKRLDSELSAAIGTQAADIADQLRQTGSAIVGILVSDD